jgi:tetratricopeptide (TPR) repeat protein
MGSAIAIFALTLVGRMAIGANYASSAQAAVVRRELSAAEEGFANAVYWQPSDRRYLLAYGGLLNWARDSKKAKEQVKAAVAAEPSADAYVGAGRLYLAMREPEDAERSFRAALEKDPYSPTAEMELLDLYRTAGRNEQMVALARKVAAQRETTYATTRAVPEMVETIYSEANLILAKEGDDRDRRLQEAFEDLDSYMRTTYPIYLRRGQYSGITDEQAAKNRDMYLSSVKASLAIRRDDTLEPWQRHVSDMFKKTVESVFNVYLDLKRHDDASQWTEDTNAVHPKLPT